MTGSENVPYRSRDLHLFYETIGRKLTTVDLIWRNLLQIVMGRSRARGSVQRFGANETRSNRCPRRYFIASVRAP